jgi:hypothetical protein
MRTHVYEFLLVKKGSSDTERPRTNSEGYFLLGCKFSVPRAVYRWFLASPLLELSQGNHSYNLFLKSKRASTSSPGRLFVGRVGLYEQRQNVRM